MLYQLSSVNASGTEPFELLNLTTLHGIGYNITHVY